MRWVGWGSGVRRERLPVGEVRRSAWGWGCAGVFSGSGLVGRGEVEGWAWGDGEWGDGEWGEESGKKDEGSRVRVEG